jgi:hypothetical protein
MTDQAGGLRSCPNGHDVRSSGRFCTTCGEPVPGVRTAAGGDRTPEHGAAVDPYQTGVDRAGDRRATTPTRRIRQFISVAALTAILIGAAVWVLRPRSKPPTTGSAFPVASSGRVPTDCPSSVDLPDGTIRNEWVALTPLPTPVALAPATSGCDGLLYVIGGIQDSGATTAAVQIYDPRQNAWSLGAPMSTARLSVGAATDGNGRIYAMGGFTALSDPSFAESNVVEVYTPARNTWTTATRGWETASGKT